MKHTLISERSARLRAEALYEQEVQLRVKAQRQAELQEQQRAQAQREAEDLRVENARIQQRHMEWISTTSATLVENLTQFSEKLLGEAIILSMPSSSVPGSEAGGVTSARKKGTTLDAMAVD